MNIQYRSDEVQLLTVEEMDTTQLTRWFALYDAVNLIADECEERGRPFSDEMLKPVHLKKYVNAACNQIATRYQRHLEEESKKYDIHS